MPLSACSQNAHTRVELRREGAEETEIVVDEEEACAACRALADKGWPIKEVPKLPYKDCTNDYCGCYYQ